MTVHPEDPTIPLSTMLIETLSVFEVQITDCDPKNKHPCSVLSTLRNFHDNWTQALLGIIPLLARRGENRNPKSKNQYL
jgi:hypothetical protein